LSRGARPALRDGINVRLRVKHIICVVEFQMVA
jgi:hypothetical protein